MLRRVHIQGFKSLLDVEVELAPLVVLLGPNAAGKSNFLEALQVFARLVTEKTVADAFEPPLRGYPVEAFSLPTEGLRGLLAQEDVELSIAGDVQPTAASNGRRPDVLRYRAAVTMKPKEGSFEVSDEYLARLGRAGSPVQKPRIERVGDHLVVRRRGEAGKPRHEPLRLNHTLASNLQFAGETRYPDFDRLRQEMASWRTYYLDPRGSMRTPQPPREVTDIGRSGELIAPFLHRLKGSAAHVKHLKAVGRALHATIPTIDKLDVDLDPTRGTLDIQVWQEGVPYSSRLVSEGTLRVLALCSIAANPWPSSLIAFEEPENGVQPRRIEVIADLLSSMASAGERQVIVTTHSPTLVAAMTRESQRRPGLISLLRCTHEGLATRIVPFDSRQYGELFEDAEIRQALSGPEDAALVEAMLVRGWLDG